MNIKIMKACLAASAVGLISIAEANTVAYWPMNLTTSGDTRTVKDSTSPAYNLSVRKAELGGVSFSDNDIGWTLPPNPDAAGAESSQFITTAPGSKDGNNYKPVLSSSAVNLCDALCGGRDFTIEGWIRPTELPTDGKWFLIAYNCYGQVGGWTWQVIENSSDPGVYTVRVNFKESDSSSQPYNMNVKLTKDELLNKWNHYALVRVAKSAKDATKGEWRFYLNGHLRGSNAASPAIATTTIASNRSFYMSGANSGTAQQVVGDMMCFRVSDTALGPGEFLCDVSRKQTVAYWTMRGITIGSAQSVPSSTGPSMDLSLRAAAQGGIAFGANDIGWTVPPNPDPLADNGGNWISDVLATVDKGLTNSNGRYSAAFSSTSRELLAALTPTNDFCVEGWFKATELPASSSANHMFVYATLGEYGGWGLNLYGADADGMCHVKVLVENKTGSSADRDTLDLGGVAATDLLNKWCHFALAYDVTLNRWKFYCNGVQTGYGAGRRIEEVSFNNPQFYFLGCPSGTAQIPTGQVTTWRVSRGAFARDSLLLGDSTASETLTWTGADGATWSDSDGKLNWKDSSGAACAWQPYKIARFDGTGAAEVQLCGAVSCSEIIFESDSDVTIFATVRSTDYIGKACESIVKKGTGTLWFEARDEDRKAALNMSPNRIRVEAGTLRASSANGRNVLGDARLEGGYAVTVLPNAKLWVDQRNAMGYSDISYVNRSCVTVLTNGILDLTCPNTFNIQTLGTLELLGGTFVLPETGHDSGCLQIRDRVTFGSNPGKTPYVFFAGDAAKKYDNLTWQYCTNTVFEVADITEDGQPDVTFFNHVLALGSWQEATGDACCFRKTGAGTMVLAQNARDRHSADVVYPTAVNTVEEGELCIDCDYSGPTFAVSSGAYLSGTGTVSNATLADGAGLRGVMNKRGGLKVMGDCALGASGTVELRRAADGKLHSVTLLTVDGAFTGTENLANWTLTVDGEPAKDIRLCVVGNKLKAQANIGLVLTVR